MVKHYEVCFSAKAVEDLDRLFGFLAERASAEIAYGYLERIENACLLLRTFPQRGSVVSGSVEGVRTMGFERRATILFRVGEQRVDVLRVLYGGRSMEELGAGFAS
jgi:toxin ParE1/3/4